MPPLPIAYSSLIVPQTRPQHLPQIIWAHSPSKYPCSELSTQILKGCSEYNEWGFCGKEPGKGNGRISTMLSLGYGYAWTRTILLAKAMTSFCSLHLSRWASTCWWCRNPRISISHSRSWTTSLPSNTLLLPPPPLTLLPHLHYLPQLPRPCHFSWPSSFSRSGWWALCPWSIPRACPPWALWTPLRPTRTACGDCVPRTTIEQPLLFCSSRGRTHSIARSTHSSYSFHLPNWPCHELCTGTMSATTVLHGSPWSSCPFSYSSALPHTAHCTDTRNCSATN